MELEGIGRLLDGPSLIGPLTRIPCLWFRYKIEHRESHQDSRGSRSTWSIVQSGVSDGVFLLEDDTGRCIIDPEGAEVIAADSDVWYGHDNFSRSGPPARKSWFRFGSGDYRYTEQRLMPGSIYALGWFNTLRNAAGDVNTEVSALLREWKGDQPGLLARFDRDRDGQIDLQEWDSARAAALQEVLKLRSHRPHASSSNVLARSANDRQPFLLSALSQRALAWRYRRHSLLALLGTIIGVAATLWFVSARLGSIAG